MKNLRDKTLLIIVGCFLLFSGIMRFLIFRDTSNRDYILFEKFLLGFSFLLAIASYFWTKYKSKINTYNFFIKKGFKATYPQKVTYNNKEPILNGYLNGYKVSFQLRDQEADINRPSFKILELNLNTQKANSNIKIEGKFSDVQYKIIPIKEGQNSTILKLSKDVRDSFITPELVMVLFEIGLELVKKNNLASK